MRIHLQLSAEASGVREPLPLSDTAMQLARLRSRVQEELSGENAGRREEQVRREVPSAQEAVHGLGSMGQSANTSASAAASSTESDGTSVPRGTSAGPSAGSTWSSSSSTTSASFSSSFSGPFMTAEGAGAPPFPFTFASGGTFPPGMQSMGPAPAGGAQAARFVFGAGPPGGPPVFPWQQVGF